MILVLNYKTIQPTRHRFREDSLILKFYARKLRAPGVFSRTLFA